MIKTIEQHAARVSNGWAVVNNFGLISYLLNQVYRKQAINYRAFSRKSPELVKN